MTLTDFQRELCDTSPFDFTDLRALYVNCTLKPSPELSHTQGLVDVSVAIMEANGVGVDQFRAVDHALAAGVYPDMREHGAVSDEWPALYERVQAADMLVVAPLTCPHCGARGSLVLNYGPESTAEEADVLLALAEPRHPPDPGVAPE